MDIVFILYCLCGIFLFIQIYYLLIFGKLSFQKVLNDDKEEIHPISVIIAAKNEYENLKKNLPIILDQAYNNFEVIVVNDGSWDDTENLLKQFSEQYKNLKVVSLEENDKYRHGKKFAITMGIKAAKNEYLLFTDADCVPLNRDWIKSMQAGFVDGKELVLGFSPYRKTVTPLNYVIRYDTLITAIQYFSFALNKNPYMGVGRNLAYKKELFFKNKGFASHMHILSGDDDLFVNAVANKNNVNIVVNKNSFILSEPKYSLADYIKQKTRHFSAGKMYKLKHKIQLSLIPFSAIAFFLVLLALAFFKVDWRIIASLFGIRFLFQVIIYYNAFKKLNSADLFWIFPILDIIQCISIPLFAFLNLLTRKLTWK